MALPAGVETWLERFFPSLVRDLQSLGPGELSGRPVNRTAHGTNGIKGIYFNIEYALKDGYLVKIEQRLALKICPPAYVPGPNAAPINLADWDHFRYRLWYGRRLEDSIFRFELHGLSAQGLPEYHVHVTFPEKADHVPAVDFDPDTTKMDPREFVRLVERYRTHKIFPVVRKKPKS